MRSEPKRDYLQQRLVFARKEVWEKLPQPSRVRCRELIVELLRAVVFISAIKLGGNMSEKISVEHLTASIPRLHSAIEFSTRSVFISKGKGANTG